MGRPKSEYVQLYPNEHGEMVPFEELTTADRMRNLERFGQAPMFEQVVDLIEARALLGRMLIERLGSIAIADPIIRADIERCIPKRKGGRPVEWDLQRRTSFLAHYFFLLAFENGPRSDVLDRLALAEGLGTTQAVEDKISECLKIVSAVKIQEMRRAIEAAASEKGQDFKIDPQ